MKGLHLKSITGTLNKVPVMFAAKPAQTIKSIEGKFPPQNYRASRGFVFSEKYYQLPFEAFSNFTFDEICKLRFSSPYMMDRTVEHVFERQPNFEIVRKINSSWWRWGVGRGTWNELVDVYNCIRGFSLNLPADFAIRLDYTTGYNPRGYSKFSRIYLDGVFAFLVYYKGEHVMTIGFSFMENRRLLIQQVQLAKPVGNRWLFKLPQPRLEFVIEAFARSFPNFTLYVVDGKSLMENIHFGYKNSLQRVIDFLERHESSPSGLYSESYVELRREEMTKTQASIAHVEFEMPRIARFYADCGKHRLSSKMTINQTLHRKLELVP